MGLERCCSSGHDEGDSSLLEMDQQRTVDDGFEMYIEYPVQSSARVVVQEPSYMAVEK